MTDPYPWAATTVFTQSITEPPDPRVTCTAEPAPGVVRRLKEQDGSTIDLAGGGALARSLFDVRLVDELIVKINPALLGGGIGLALGIASSVPLRLRSTKVHDSGVVVLRYEVLPPS